ncbi:MAG: GNAT family N-acetyltransferase [Candidatus Chromulinivorax sp.]
MKLFKNIALFVVLFSSLSSYSQNFSLKIDDELWIDRYQQDHNKQSVKQMLKDFYQIADDIQLSVEQKNQYENLENKTKKLEDQFDDFDVDVVLLYKGKIIGACCYDADEASKDAQLYMIMIDKNYRKQGFAEKFLLKIMDLHKFFGMKTMSLSAHPITNSAAIKLYKKVGFKKLGMNSNNQSLEEFKKNL